MNNAIPLKEFERLFPFYLLVDTSGSILQTGPTLQKLLSHQARSARFDHIFQVLRPQGKDFQFLIHNTRGEMIRLKLSTRETEFMGQMIPLDGEQFLFAINMMVQDASELTTYGLNFNDFAIQDPIFDFLMLLQTQKRAIRHADTMNKKLIEANKVAVQASQTKSQFLANMSHELRTPLNGLIGMASILAETKLDSDQEDFLKTIITSADSMLALVNDILDLSKIEAGFIQLDISKTNFQTLLQEVFDTVRPLASKKNLRLSLDILPGVPQSISTDPLRLRQVIINLLGNAIKFTLKGDVSLRVEPETSIDKQTSIKMTFTDSGIGMNEETLSRIFSPFVQGDSSMTKKFEGTGLGLSICKKLIEAMEGNISVTSKEGVGTQFIARIPVEILDSEVLQNEVRLKNA